MILGHFGLQNRVLASKVAILGSEINRFGVLRRFFAILLDFSSFWPPKTKPKSSFFRYLFDDFLYFP